ncbi:MAG: MBL fold metallo-hydrolase [Candidatus Heimdallarchaeota archaeon]|nr:MBL fold metallo-hydrolase [Candidatus Heimdallarchaeota archaeon]
MTFDEINDGIWNVYGEHGPGGERNAVYIVMDEKIAIIDTGIQNTIQHEIWECIDHAGRKANDVKYIMLTREHHDAIGGANKLVDMFPKAELLCHRDAEDTIRKPYLYLPEKHFEPNKKGGKFSYEPWERLRGIKPHAVFQSDDKFKLGETTLYVVAYPGFSIGHSMFFSSKQKAIFTGAELYIYPMRFSNYFIDLTGSVTERENALSFISRANVDMLCPAYDGAYLGTQAKELIKQALRAHQTFEETILVTLTTNGASTFDEIKDEVYLSLGIEWYKPWKDLVNDLTLKAHMKKLEDEDKIFQSSKKRQKEPLWEVHDDAKIDPENVMYY